MCVNGFPVSMSECCRLYKVCLVGIERTSIFSGFKVAEGFLQSQHIVSTGVDFILVDEAIENVGDVRRGEGKLVPVTILSIELCCFNTA